MTAVTAIGFLLCLGLVALMAWGMERGRHG